MDVRNCFVAILAGLALTAGGGCSALPSGLGGETTANGDLRQDTLALIETFARARLDCRRLDGIYAQVMVTADRQGEGMAPGAVREHWTATGCDRRAVFVVTFTPDGDGRTATDVALHGAVREIVCPGAPRQGATLGERMAAAGTRCR